MEMWYGQQSQPLPTLWYYGLLVLVFIIVVVLLAIYCCNRHEPFESLRQSPAPLVFPKQLLAIPGECSPWYGCDWNTTPCKSNRDCQSFRRCDQGKCI